MVIQQNFKVLYLRLKPKLLSNLYVAVYTERAKNVLFKHMEINRTFFFFFFTFLHLPGIYFVISVYLDLGGYSSTPALINFK